MRSWQKLKIILENLYSGGAKWLLMSIVKAVLSIKQYILIRTTTQLLLASRLANGIWRVPNLKYVYIRIFSNSHHHVNFQNTIFLNLCFVFNPSEIFKYIPVYLKSNYEWVQNTIPDCCNVANWVQVSFWYV